MQTLAKMLSCALLGAVLWLTSAHAANQASYQTPTTGPMSAFTFTSVYLNPALLAVATASWGPTPPNNGPGNGPAQFQYWMDTSGSPTDVLRIYDGTQWIALATLNVSTHVWTVVVPAGGSTSSFLPSGSITAQLTSHGTGADTTEDTLQTFTLQANAFDIVGRCVKIESWGTFGADANSKTVRLYFGSTIYTSTALTSNGIGWYLWARVCKTGSNAQTSVATGTFGNSSPSTAVNTPNQTDTAAIIVKVTGQNGTAVANDVVGAGMTVMFEN